MHSGIQGSAAEGRRLVRREGAGGDGNSRHLHWLRETAHVYRCQASAMIKRRMPRRLPHVMPLLPAHRCQRTTAAWRHLFNVPARCAAPGRSGQPKPAAQMLLRMRSQRGQQHLWRPWRPRRHLLHSNRRDRRQRGLLFSRQWGLRSLRLLLSSCWRYCLRCQQRRAVLPGQPQQASLHSRLLPPRLAKAAVRSFAALRPQHSPLNVAGHGDATHLRKRREALTPSTPCK